MGFGSAQPPGWYRLALGQSRGVVAQMRGGSQIRTIRTGIESMK